MRLSFGRKPRWEYMEMPLHIMHGQPDKNGIGKLGLDGWELVAVMHDWDYPNQPKNQRSYVFKRLL